MGRILSNLTSRGALGHWFVLSFAAESGLGIKHETSGDWWTNYHWKFGSPFRNPGVTKIYIKYAVCKQCVNLVLLENIKYVRSGQFLTQP